MGVERVGWPDLAGRLTERGHVLPVRVYYEDTDFSGVVYHASYLRFMERGRTEFLRCLGFHQISLDVAFAVRRMTIEFLRPARMDDVLEVVTVSGEVRGASLDVSQQVIRDGAPLVTASVKVVVIDRDGRARRLPDDLRAAFSGRD